MSALDADECRRVFAGALSFIVRPHRDAMKWAKPYPGFVLMPGGVLATEGELQSDAYGIPAVVSAAFVEYLRTVGPEKMFEDRIIAYARVCARHFYGIHAVQPAPDLERDYFALPAASRN